MRGDNSFFEKKFSKLLYIVGIVIFDKYSICIWY